MGATRTRLPAPSGPIGRCGRCGGVVQKGSGWQLLDYGGGGSRLVHGPDDPSGCPAKHRAARAPRLP